jgi:hypothetical protein
MDSRIARVRPKLAKVPYAAMRSHSFGEEKHGFRLEPPLPDAKVGSRPTITSNSPIPTAAS